MGAAVVGLQGCTVGPPYEHPALHTPTQYQELHPDRVSSPLSQPTASTADLTRWWSQFHDAQLDALVQQALRSNLDLRAARVRVREAREQEIIARSAYFPSVALSGSAAHVWLNSNPLAGIGGGPSSGGNNSFSTNLYALGFDARWEPDLFGGTRRSVEAARASGEATDWQLADTQVSLTAEVARDYVALRALQTRMAILKDSIGHQQEQLTIADARARFGFVTELDVNQQRTQLEATKAQLPSLQAEESAQIHALAVLLGREPEELSEELRRAGPLPMVPANLPVGLPGDLLRRRPDIRAAERRLAAANAQIGVAVSKLYPSVNLLALPTMASSMPGDLFSSNGLGYIAAGMINWPIFEGSQLRANVRIKKEQREESYLQYQKAVLAALQETEDDLGRYSAEQRRLESLRQSRAAAASSLHIAEEQYRAGLVTFINVLDAQAALLTAQDDVAQSEQALAEDWVALYKALGGGWTPEPSAPDTPDTSAPAADSPR